MPSSFRCAPSAFQLQCGSEAGRANCINGRRAHGATSRFASVCERSSPYVVSHIWGEMWPAIVCGIGSTWMAFLGKLAADPEPVTRDSVVFRLHYSVVDGKCHWKNLLVG